MLTKRTARLENKNAGAAKEQCNKTLTSSQGVTVALTVTLTICYTTLYPMEKFHDANQPVTKKEFRVLEKEFRVLTSDFQEFADFVAENVALKKDIDASTEKILNSNDKLLHEVKAMREEQVAHSANHSDIAEDMQDIRKRLKQVEAHAGIC